MSGEPTDSPGSQHPPSLPTWLLLGPLLIATVGLALLAISHPRLQRGYYRLKARVLSSPPVYEEARLPDIAPSSPADSAPPAEAFPKSDVPLVAIVIDDLGYDLAAVERLLALQVPMTFAVLPGRKFSDEAAALVIRDGRELILHQPMEPLPAQVPLFKGSDSFRTKHIDPGPGGVFLDMKPQKVAEKVEQNLSHFPGITGMNNHMGSAFTQNSPLMHAALAPLLSRGFYFLDSRTHADAVGFQVAAEMGLRTVQRDVFLDHEQTVDFVSRQFEALLRIAREQGSAVAIGHPHPETLEVLEREIPGVEARGFRLVSAGVLAHTHPEMGADPRLAGDPQAN
ncbi:MAG: divergent polysaccharide deacetylase family protein [Chrysiogenetes bacterium]|nr:divergent polysaccharide deacetylase family protein [Chrysiogenetes bacterium]